MSVICKNCRKPSEAHVWVHGSQACLTTFYEPDEPLKAKPGVRYHHVMMKKPVRFGTPDGRLRWCGADNVDAQEIVPMSADWIEVPE